MVDFKSDLEHHDNVNSPAHYKYGKKEKLSDYMQLERALGRIKDQSRVEEFGLEEIFPNNI